MPMDGNQGSINPVDRAKAPDAIWVHGYTACPELIGVGWLANVNNLTWTDIVGFRQGSQVTFRGANGTHNWFHFAIPTPTLTEGIRASLKRVYVLYRTQPNVQIDEIQVYDGPNMKLLLNGLDLSGSHTLSIDGQNNWELADLPPVFWGVGISVGVKFRREGNIVFASAGADFSRRRSQNTHAWR